MSDKVVYDQSLSATKILDIFARGDTVICPKCGATLTVAIDDEVAQALRVHRGIFCPRDHQHVSILVDPAPPPGFWEKFGSK